MKKVSRREFIKQGALFAGVVAGVGSIPNIVFTAAKAGQSPATTPSPAKSIIAVAQKGEPAALTRRALAAIGGIAKFVKKGDIVLVKPNIGWDRRPEQAANTNPDVVKTLVELCLSAGAKEVQVFDNTCNDPRRCYSNSGIEAAVKSAGGNIYFMDNRKYKSVNVPRGDLVKSWLFYQDFLDADVYINVPIAKHHGLAGLTLGMKNIMGVIGGNRGEIHANYDRKIAELNTVRKPNLTVIDAYRILTNHGPQGGNPADVKLTETIIASVDMIAADAYATTLFGRQPTEFEHLRIATEFGLGESDLKKINILKV
ncbi:MAG: DUF362 domain-containing protein [bacterium]|nr:DUF362 domain-containing protein [bacterium]